LSLVSSRICRNPEIKANTTPPIAKPIDQPISNPFSVNFDPKIAIPITIKITGNKQDMVINTLLKSINT
jgi:hypothetical protein